VEKSEDHVKIVRSRDAAISASATGFALCVAFLAAWGFQGQGHWRAINLLVLVPMTFASLGFGLTPLLAARPIKTPLDAARKLYGVSVLSVIAGVLCAVTIKFGK
jgi:hypothetical protein